MGSVVGGGVWDKLVDAVPYTVYVYNLADGRIDDDDALETQRGLEPALPRFQQRPDDRGHALVVALAAGRCHGPHRHALGLKGVAG